MDDKDKAFWAWWEVVQSYKNLYNLRMAFEAGWEAAIKNQVVNDGK